MVQSLIETLFFYHPAVWWISARIREERENCCDDRAVAICGNHLDYARALTALESMRAGNWSLAPSARGGSLSARVRRILGVEPAEEGQARGLAGTLTLTTLAFLGLVLLVTPGPAPARAAVEDQKVVTGKVVTPDGKAIAGADVWLVAETYPEPKAIVLRRGRSDEAGRFRLIWDEKPFKGRFLGCHAIWAQLPGFRPARAMFQDPWNESGVDPDRPITLTIAPTAATQIPDPRPRGQPGGGRYCHGRFDPRGPDLGAGRTGRAACRRDRSGRAGNDRRHVLRGHPDCSGGVPRSWHSAVPAGERISRRERAEALSHGCR